MIILQFYQKIANLATMEAKKFIVINEEFCCDHCGQENTRLSGSCRNHCRYCLYSKHLDSQNPGDRLSTCGSLMPPIAVEQDGKRGWMIIHQCRKCAKIIRNKAADDDNFDQIIALSKIPYEQTRA